MNRNIPISLKKDLTPQEARSIFINLAIPVIIELVLVEFIASFDLMMVGQLGYEAISAVGYTTQPLNLIQTLILAFNVGIMTMVGRFKGAEDREGANRFLLFSVLFAAGLMAVLTVAAEFFIEPLLLVCGADRELLPLSVSYFRIVILGNFFYSIGLAITSAQRGAGSTRISLVINLTANIVNILFNYLLIYGKFGFPRLEVRGAGIATAIGHTAAFCIAMSTILGRKGYLTLRRNPEPSAVRDQSSSGAARSAGSTIFPEKNSLSEFWNISSGVIIERFTKRIGVIMFVKAVAVIGTHAFAAYSIYNRMINITFAFGDGVGVAATAMISQCIGAGNRENGRLVRKISLRMAFLLSLFTFAVLFPGAGTIAGFFTRDEAVLRMATTAIHVVAVCGLFQLQHTTACGLLRGAGDTKYVAKLITLCTMVMRPILAWGLCVFLGLGLTGIWITVLVEHILRAVLSRKRVGTRPEMN